MFRWTTPMPRGDWSWRMHSAMLTSLTPGAHPGSRNHAFLTILRIIFILSFLISRMVLDVATLTGAISVALGKLSVFWKLVQRLIFFRCHFFNWLHTVFKRRRPKNDNITLPGTAATGVFSTSSEVSTFGISIDYITVKRLDQGHLHSKLEVLGLTCPFWESNPGLQGGRRALKKKAIRTAC